MFSLIANQLVKVIRVSATSARFVHRLCGIGRGACAFAYAIAFQEKVEIAAHDEVRGESHLKRRTLAFGEKFAQDAKRHSALGAGTLINGSRNVA